MAGENQRWVAVTPSAAIEPGEAVAVEIGDLDLVVWRTAGGRPVVMDARCPHQWSHLAAEGAVDGDELVCTAHFWRFDADGAGSKVSVRGRRDPKADVAAFPSRETGGVIEAQLPR